MATLIFRAKQELRRKVCLPLGFPFGSALFAPESEFVFAQDFPVCLYACDAPTAVEALRRDLILRSRVLVDPRQVKPAVGIEFVRRSQMKLAGSTSGG